MEILKTEQCFYINGIHRNVSRQEELCEVVVTDDHDILDSSDKYCVGLVRWEVDSFSSLFFLKADENASVCADVLFALPGGTFWNVHHGYCAYLDENQPSLTAFLAWWNSQHTLNTPCRLVLSLDGAGRFKIQPILTEHAIAGRKVAAQLQMSDSMAGVLRMSEATTFIEYTNGHKRNIMEYLKFLEQIIEENESQYILDVAVNPAGSVYSRFNDTLKNVARHILRFDRPDESNAETHVKREAVILPTIHNEHYVIEPNDRWGLLYWEAVDDQPGDPALRVLPFSQRIYVNQLVGLDYNTNQNPGYGQTWSGVALSDPGDRRPTIQHGILENLGYNTEFITADMLVGEYLGRGELALTAEAYQVRLIKITDGTSQWAHAIEIGDTLELRLDFTKVWAERHEDEPHNNNWTYRGCQQSFPIIDVAEEGGGIQLFSR